MSEQSDREAIIREIAKKKVRYVLPNMDLSVAANSPGNRARTTYMPSSTRRSFGIPSIAARRA